MYERKWNGKNEFFTLIAQIVFKSIFGIVSFSLFARLQHITMWHEKFSCFFSGMQTSYFCYKMFWKMGTQNIVPSCIGSMVWIISCNSPCRNLAPVTAAESWCGPPLPPGIGRESDVARDVTEPPGCVAIDVSDEFAALFCIFCCCWCVGFVCIHKKLFS